MGRVFSIYENPCASNMADRAFVAVLANQLYLSQPEETFNAYQVLVTKQARIGLEDEEDIELRNLSPLTLLATVLNVRRSYLDDKVYGVRMPPQHESSIDVAIGQALASGILSEYGIDVDETYKFAEALNETTRGKYSPNDVIENDDLRQELFLAVAQARIDIDFLDPERRMHDFFQDREVNQPAYMVFMDTTDAQEKHIADAIKEYDPFGLNDFLDSYIEDFESGAYFLPYEENKDISVMWAWFREYYETR